MDLKIKGNHYLHPDFEDIDINSEKKQSPLALLAQTCKNIGTISSTGDGYFCNRNRSPYLATNEQRHLSKRSHSDCSSNSCYSSTDRDYLSPIKKSRTDQKNANKKKKSKIAELKSADTSSENSFQSGTSLISNLIEFVKNSNNCQLVDADKMEFLHFLAAQSSTGSDKRTDKSKCNRDQFNVDNGYHLDSVNGSKPLNYLPLNMPQTNCPIIVPENHSERALAIKYCMYCGRLIPVLPMLLAHIRLEHSSFDILDRNLCNIKDNSNKLDIFSKFNPYVSSNSITSANSTFSFLNDYLSSSFQGLSNLIC